MIGDRKAFAEINTASSGNTTVISAPTTGHIEIDHLELIPTGGANTVIFDLGANQFEYAFDDNQGYVYDNANMNNNTLVLDEATALVMNLSAATRVTGFVLYRIVGGNN